MKPLFPPPVSRSLTHGTLVRPIFLGVLAMVSLLAAGSSSALRAQASAVAGATPAASAAGTSATAAKGDLLAVIKAAGKYGTFLKIVDAAGLTPTLEQPGPYTVFAPTDEAFSKLPAGTLDRLLKPESKTKLVTLVNYHIASGKMDLAALAKLDELKTLSGEEIDVDTATDGKTIEMDDSKIIAPDMPAANGVVQGINAVLQP